jgi:hypothetical protein
MTEPPRPAPPDSGARGGPRRERPARPDWALRFLEVFAATGNVRLAAGAAGVSRDAPYKRAQTSPPFAERWARAREDAIDTLDAEARRRALTGSDTLLMFLLRAHRPGLYRETLRIDIRGEMAKIAAAYGVDVEAALAEAEQIFARADR